MRKQGEIMNLHSSPAPQLCLIVALCLAGLGLSSSDRPAAGMTQDDAVREGWRQYSVNCARCHGDDAVAGIIAPDLRASVAKGAVNRASFQSVVSGGRREKGMPGFKDQLTTEQIGAIYAYLEARAKARLPAGRPK
jgi:mono/diheme cytochrome c family protein